MRQHGLYSSHLTDWRWQHEAGNLQGDGRLSSGPIPPDKLLKAAADEKQRRIEELLRENQRLRLRAE